MKKTSEPVHTTSLLTVAQVCAMLHIGRTKFYRLVDQGFPTVKIGGSRRVRQTSLERWLEQHEHLIG